MVRQWILIPSFEGSIPSTSARELNHGDWLIRSWFDSSLSPGKTYILLGFESLKDLLNVSVVSFDKVIQISISTHRISAD